MAMYGDFSIDWSSSGINLREWAPPAQGTTARNNMPSSCFLDQKNKKYPYKTKKDGKWVASKSGLQAAARRAGQQGATGIKAKAEKMLKSKFGAGKK